MNFTRWNTAVDALRFDGSLQSAQAAARLFPFKVARHVERNDTLMIVTVRGLALVAAGEWITEDVASGAMRSFSDADFRSRHDALPY